MHFPTIPISDRDTLMKAAKHPDSSAVRVERTWTSVIVEQEGLWRDRPAIRFFYEVDVNTVEGRQTWTYAEVVRLDEDGRLMGDSLQEKLQREQIQSEIMRSQSGSL